ncbi:MAG: sulfotransferase [Steroidobacteraceae bacterium]
MNLRSADYLLTRFAQALPGQMKLLGDIETDLLGDRLDAIEIDRPVFITGLARSGTTLLLNLLAKLPQVATHRYRDFPFLFVPVAWNRLQRRMGGSGAPVERPHRDRIKITKDSPEAFEEPIWAYFFPTIHDPDALHRLTAADRQPRFDVFFLQHLRKLLMLRGGRRYVSKGNYNVTRIEYLADLLPEARFVIPVRHPVAQVESLMRQHRLFTEYSERDNRVPQYLRAAGHFEFGPQRVPVNIDFAHARRIGEAWSRGDDELGYALMWRSIYSHVAALRRANGRLARRIEFIRYEALCSDPEGELRRIARFCDFRKGIDVLLAHMPEISPRKPDSVRLSSRQRARVWSAAGEAAESLGYSPEELAA